MAARRSLQGNVCAAETSVKRARLWVLVQFELEALAWQDKSGRGATSPPSMLRGRATLAPFLTCSWFRKGQT